MARSFFPLTPPRPAPSEEHPLLALTSEECAAFCAEAQPLVQALVEVVNASSETHPALHLMAYYIAADMLREMRRQDMQEAHVDA